MNTDGDDFRVSKTHNIAGTNDSYVNIKNEYIDSQNINGNVTLT